MTIPKEHFKREIMFINSHMYIYIYCIFFIANNLFISIMILKYKFKTNITNFAARWCQSNLPSALSTSYASWNGAPLPLKVYTKELGERDLIMNSKWLKNVNTTCVIFTLIKVIFSTKQFGVFNFCTWIFENNEFIPALFNNTRKYST